jgi:hypothetical protein
MSVVVNEFEVVPQQAQPQQPQQQPAAEPEPLEVERMLHEVIRTRAARVERLRAG